VLRGIAGGLLFAAVGFAVGWVAAVVEDRRVAKAVADRGKEVEGKVAALEGRIEEMQRAAAPATVWVAVTIRLDYIEGVNVEWGSGTPANYRSFVRVGAISAEATLTYAAARRPDVGWPRLNASGGVESDAFTYVTYSLPVPYDAGGLSPGRVDARLRALEKDAARADLPPFALDVLFGERDALLGARTASFDPSRSAH
jgi:hypothetical protein